MATLGSHHLEERVGTLSAAANAICPREIEGGVGAVMHRTATSVRQLRRDRMEQGPTEPHARRSTFLLSSGGAGGERVLLSGLWYGADHHKEPVSLPDARGLSGRAASPT